VRCDRNLSVIQTLFDFDDCLNGGCVHSDVVRVCVTMRSEFKAIAAANKLKKIFPVMCLRCESC
jgi:hypothetical protein